MKKRGYINLLFAVIGLVIIYCAYEMLNPGKEVHYYSVSVILDDSSSERWNAFKEGLNQGASEYRIHLNVVSAGKNLSLEEEYAIIKRELDSGAQGLILEPWGDDEDGSMAGILSGCPTVLVESGVSSMGDFVTVSPDNYEMGRALAQSVLADTENPSGMTVGILSGNQNQLSMKQRLAGFKEALEEAGAQISWELPGNLAGMMARPENYVQQHPADVVAALSNDETERAVDILLADSQTSFALYGVGRSEKTVYYLDKGLIRELVVPNEYYMGYQSVALLAQTMEYHTTETGQYETEFLTVNRENLYEEENSRILFPTVR